MSQPQSLVGAPPLITVVHRGANAAEDLRLQRLADRDGKSVEEKLELVVCAHSAAGWPL